MVLLGYSELGDFVHDCARENQLLKVAHRFKQRRSSRINVGGHLHRIWDVFFFGASNWRFLIIACLLLVRVGKTKWPLLPLLHWSLLENTHSEVCQDSQGLSFITVTFLELKVRRPVGVTGLTLFLSSAR